MPDLFSEGIYKREGLLLSGSVLDEARGRGSGRPFMASGAPGGGPPGGGFWGRMTERALPGERAGPEGAGSSRAGSEEAGTHTGSSSSGTEGRSGGIEKDCRLIGRLGVLEDQMIKVKM